MLLAFETSSNVCSVALATPEQIYTKQAYLPQQHGQVLLDWTAELLQQAQVTKQQLIAIAYSCGPGGFTGIRMSAAIAQGLAMALNCKVIAVPTLQVVAQGIYRQYSYRQVVVIHDARMQQVYTGAYHLAANSFMQAYCSDSLQASTAIKLDFFAQQNYALVVNMPIPDIINDNNNHSNIIQIITDFSAQAYDVAILAIDRMTREEHLAFDQQLPVYLRGEEGWKKLNN